MFPCPPPPNLIVLLSDSPCYLPHASKQRDNVMNEVNASNVNMTNMIVEMGIKGGTPSYYDGDRMVRHLISQGRGLGLARLFRRTLSFDPRRRIIKESKYRNHRT